MKVENKIRCSVIFALVVISFFCNAQNGNSVFEEKHLPSDLHEDIDFVKARLEKQHPNLYWYISKQELNKKFDSLKKTIKRSITNSDFRYKVACVLACIGDGHLSLKFDSDKLYPQDLSKYNGSKIFPIQQFEYKVIGKKLYVIRSKVGNNSILPGSEIIAIDNRPSSEIISALLLSLPSDGYNQTFKNYYLNIGMFSEIFPIVFGFRDTLSFRIRIGNYEKTFSLKSNTSLYKANVTPPPVNQFILERNYAYIRVGTFNGGLGDPYYNMFATVKKSKVSNLILDLRNNVGGDHENMIKLFSYLIEKPTFFSGQAKEIRDDVKLKRQFMSYGSETPIIPSDVYFHGKIYVLINGGCFSAASLVAANLQSNGQALLIGEETGGGRNGCIGGNFVQTSLPNSQLLLRFGTVPIEVPISSDIIGRGVMPDVPISYTLHDFISGSDLEYIWAKKNIDLTSK